MMHPLPYHTNAQLSCHTDSYQTQRCSKAACHQLAVHF